MQATTCSIPPSAQAAADRRASAQSCSTSSRCPHHVSDFFEPVHGDKPYPILEHESVDISSECTSAICPLKVTNVCTAREQRSGRKRPEEIPAIQKNQKERRQAGGLWFSRRQFLQSAAAAAAGLIALNQTAKVGAKNRPPFQLPRTSSAFLVDGNMKHLPYAIQLFFGLLSKSGWLVSFCEACPICSQPACAIPLSLTTVRCVWLTGKQAAASVGSGLGGSGWRAI